ncbi:hypothetical protein, partial [Escherichia coli]|uniref:hypothetical protein n=4 Tax=Escherichia coli TaxID=562 RepID=UPI001BC84847
NKNNRTSFIHINCPDITGHKISIYRFTKIQAERPVFATTSAFNVLYRFSGIKNPLSGGFKLFGVVTTLNRIFNFLRS